MANQNAPFGLGPINQDGTPWNGQGILCYFPASQAVNIFRGDPVTPLGGSDANGVPAVGLAAAGAGNTILGSYMGPMNGPAGSGVTLLQNSPIYFQAGVVGYGLICPSGSTLFSIQEDSVGGSISAALGSFANGNLVAGAGSTATGFSGWQLQSSSVSATANPTYQLRLLGLTRGPDNALGTNARWVVRINLNALSSTSGV